MANNFTDELPGKMESDFSDFLHELETKPSYSEQELLQLMGKAAYDFDTASKFIARYGVTLNKRRQKLRTILLAKRIDLLQNEKLKAHLEVCFKEPENPKESRYKPTKEDLESFIDTELGEMAEQIERAESIAKSAEKLHDMFQKQISWYQSVLKRETAELMTLNRGA